MKKTAFICAAALMMGTVALAQPGPQGPKPEFNKEEAVQKKTEMMAEKYGLNDDQQAKLLELNTEYADVLAPQGRPQGPRHGGPEMGPRPEGPQGPEMGPRPEGPEEGKPELTEEQKEEMKAKMEERKAEMEAAKEEFEAKMAERKEKIEAYENELKNLLGEENYEAYKQDQERRAHGPQHGGPRPGGPRGPQDRPAPENHDAEAMPITE